MTNLVLIQAFDKEQPAVMELFHYVGKKFEGSIAMDTSQFNTSDEIKVVVEDFRVRGVAMLA